MMASLQKFFTQFTHLFVPKEEQHTRPIARPVRDWKIMLIVVALGLVLDAGGAGLVYYDSSTAGEEQSNTSTVVPKSKLKSADLKAVLDAFAARAALHSSYMQGGGGLSDPSR